jgi:hypothetical protein
LNRQRVFNVIFLIQSALVKVVLPVLDIATLNYELPSRFAGIRVIGDVYGDLTAFSQAVNEARDHGISPRIIAFKSRIFLIKIEHFSVF